MGLDMYAFKVKPEFVVDPEQQADLDIKPADDSAKSNAVEIAYWRKFNHLHGWMEDLYRAKDGQDEQFNCANVRLMPEDLDKLEAAVTAGPLKSRAGFFFGSSDWQEGNTENVLNFVKDARKAIEEGNIVFYDSWW